MIKRYVVTGTWVDKTTNKPMSGIAEITSGVNKQGNPYEVANTESRETPIEGSYPVGTVLTATVQLAAETASESTGKTPLKINSRE